MTCEHPRKWEMASSVLTEEEKRKRLLDEGWEPYAAIPETEYSNICHYFRRLKPCEECKKV